MACVCNCWLLGCGFGGGGEMKAVCIIASDNVVIDGDIVFCKSIGVCAWYYRGEKNITYRNAIVFRSFPSRSVKLMALWFWHMVVLRKSHVYLTGVLK